MATMTISRLIAGALSVAIGVSFGQAFEATSVKPSDPARPESFWRVSPGRLTVQKMSLKSLIMAFYNVKQFQVVGGPKWIDTDKFDIMGKLPDDVSDSDARSPKGAERLTAAAKTLLADHFQLVFHVES